MKYLCVRIVYPDGIHDTPCQSLVGIDGLLEYDNEYECMFVGGYGNEDSDICIPITKEAYIGLLNVLKLRDVVDTELYGFHYDDETFASIYDVIKERNRHASWKE